MEDGGVDLYTNLLYQSFLIDAAVFSLQRWIFFSSQSFCEHFTWILMCFHVQFMQRPIHLKKPISIDGIDEYWSWLIDTPIALIADGDIQNHDGEFEWTNLWKLVESGEW